MRTVAIVAAVLALIAMPLRAATLFFHEWADESHAGAYCAMALDAQSRPHIAYWDTVVGVLKYAVRRNGSWQVETVDNSGFVGTDPAIAVDSQGNPHISYYDATNARLKYATKNGGIWVFEIPDPLAGPHGTATDIVLDGQELPHISYWDAPNNDLKHAYKLSNGTWATEILRNAAGNATETRLVIGSQGEIYYRLRIGTSVLNPNGSVNAPGYDFGFELAPWGTPYEAYYLAAGDLYAQGELVTSSSVSNDMYISFAYDPDGQPHVAYASQATKVLYHAHKDGSWMIQSMSVPQIQASYNSIAVDAYGNTSIAYYDPVAGSLGFLHEGVLLTSALVDVTWPVGSERSIAWRGSGRVDISLSVDGGASWQTLVSTYGGVGDGTFGEYQFTVPHTPSRFCKIKVERVYPGSVDVSEGLFTIEADISLLNFVITLPGDGAVASWSTDPGPGDLSRYRLQKQTVNGWTDLVETSQTSYRDATGQSGDRYRLFAVNGLGQEFMLGEAAASASLPPRLSAWPSPYHDGTMSISFVANPFTGTDPVEVTIFDVAGRRVRTVARDRYPRGVHVVTWDGLDDKGARVSSGQYFIRVQSGPTTETRKIVVVR